jgi:predicted MFS family arabinose efflux permease
VVVSAYAFSAGISGLLTAGFADRYDRKRCCCSSTPASSSAPSGAAWRRVSNRCCWRASSGLFGGVIGSIVLAIATDLFPRNMRGRVMGLIQTAFAASQVLGIPAGIYLSNQWNWHVPFIAMAAFGLAGGLLVAWQMQPVNAHLKQPQEHSAWLHLYHTLTEREHLLAFAITALLTTGGFMLMPFSSAYIVNNMGIDLQHLPTVYLVTGLCTIFIGPLIGRRPTRGQVPRSCSVLRCRSHGADLHPPGPHLAAGPDLVNTVMFVGIFSRMIPVQAISRVPTATSAARTTPSAPRSSSWPAGWPRCWPGTSWPGRQRPVAAL